MFAASVAGLGCCYIAAFLQQKSISSSVPAPTDAGNDRLANDGCALRSYMHAAQVSISSAVCLQMSHTMLPVQGSASGTRAARRRMCSGCTIVLLMSQVSPHTGRGGFSRCCESTASAVRLLLRSLTVCALMVALLTKHERHCWCCASQPNQPGMESAGLKTWVYN